MALNMGTGKKLGRGLAAIFNDLQTHSVPKSESEIVAIEVPMSSIITNPEQPRKFFDETKMQELIESVKLEGVLQPILVRKFFSNQKDATQIDSENADSATTAITSTVSPTSDSSVKYQIIAGERRWRAATANKMTTIPAVIIECNEQTALQLGLMENLQRDNLSALEEAASIKTLISNFGKTQEEIADLLCKSRSYITNTLRLLKLPQKVQEMLQNKQISAGHARAILESDDPEGIAERIVEGRLSVRETEMIVRKQRENEQQSATASEMVEGREDSERFGLSQNRRLEEMPQGRRFEGMPQNRRSEGLPQNRGLEEMPQNRRLEETPQSGLSLKRKNGRDRNHKIHHTLPTQSSAGNAEAPHAMKPQATDYSNIESNENIHSESDYDLMLLEKVLADSIGVPVKVTQAEMGCIVQMTFDNLQELDTLLAKLK
jgi:ParB family chromosome partitioning protein